jgi:hypothetical protein
MNGRAIAELLFTLGMYRVLQRAARPYTSGEIEAIISANHNTRTHWSARVYSRNSG